MRLPEALRVRVSPRPVAFAPTALLGLPENLRKSVSLDEEPKNDLLNCGDLCPGSRRG